MRVVLIGPVPPYRGGIAQYTAQLHASLAETDEQFTISFSRQFPAFMYPGGSDKEPEPHSYLPAVEYIIDSANPLTWPAVGRRIQSLNPDLIVVQWWHVYWAPFIIWMKRLARRSGKRMVVICHNVDDHESAGWKVKLRGLALGGCKELFVHSSRHREVLGEMFPAASIRMHPIPAYDAFPAPDTKLPRRARTELLFFGLIRPYKGLDILLRALTQLADRDFHLTIAGESWDGVASYERMIGEGGLSEKVDMLNAYVSNQSAANLFARADAVVLPYRSASGSAVAALAFNYRKPVIASEVGGLLDVVAPGAGILVEPGNVDALADALSRVMKEERWYEPEAIEATNERLTWRSLASELKEAPPMEASRLSHAILDAESRNAKARKIALLSGTTTPKPGMRMLEVGCGSGFIASYFSKLGFGPNGTFATDINDERQVREGYSFHKVDDTKLPFPDEHFDLIVTNHVIEHVGDLAEQRRHLDEIHRCLKRDGTLYFAVPNKWRLFEAHYKLPLLSWLPAPIADRYIRLRGAKHRYDCRPLSRGESETLLSEAGFEAKDKTIDAIRVVGDLEGDVGSYQFAKLIPDALFRATRAIVPTLIFVARKRP